MATTTVAESASSLMLSTGRMLSEDNGDVAFYILIGVAVVGLGACAYITFYRKTVDYGPMDA